MITRSPSSSSGCSAAAVWLRRRPSSAAARRALFNGVESPFGRRAQALGDAVHELLRRRARRLGRLRDLLPVLVHPDEEVDVVAAQPVKARDRVGADLLEGVAEVRVAMTASKAAGPKLIAVGAGALAG